MSKLWTEDLATMIQFPAGARDFPFFHNVQISSGVHPASYRVGTGNPFPENKMNQAWAYCCSPLIGKVKKAWCYGPIPPYTFMTEWVTKHMDNCTFMTTIWHIWMLVRVFLKCTIQKSQEHIKETSCFSHEGLYEVSYSTFARNFRNWNILRPSLSLLTISG